MAYIGPEPVPGQNREVDDISSSFNGSTTAFTLQVSGVNVSPESANNILVNLGGVLQNPGTDYTIAASTITFTTAPASGLSFFALVLGAGINTATVADQTISTSKVLDNAITADKLAHTSVTAGSYTTADITVDAQGRITAAANGTIAQSEIANDAVGADQLASNAVVNDSVASNAAIAGTKISPDFGSQNIVKTGDANINGGDLTVTGGEGVSAVLKLVADQGDDNGDGWRLISNQDDNDLTISNNISGSYADKLTLKNNGDLHILDKIIHDGDTNTAIRFPSADTVSVETAGSERLRIDSSGAIGIGTTSPASSFVLSKGGGETQIELNRTDTNTTGNVGVIKFTANDGHVVASMGAYGDGDNEGAYINFKVTSAASGTNPFNTTSEALRIKSDKNIEVTDGDLQFASGHGVSFAATSDAAGMTSELLDDYEEGTFTATLPNGGGSVSIGSQMCKYHKIGGVVHVQIALSNIQNHAVVDITIGGLPFTSSSSSTSVTAVLTNRPALSDGLIACILDNEAFVRLRSAFASDGQKGSIFNGYGIDINLTYTVN